MIRYALTCDRDHAFEGWFRDSAAFDAQRLAGDIACPACGSHAVEKSIMAPAVSTRRDAPAQAAPAQVPVAAPGLRSAPDPKMAEMIETLRRLKRHVTENSEDVGARFTDEARKIHYEEAEARAIHGVASPEDAKALLDEGIEVLPLPVLPEEHD